MIADSVVTPALIREHHDWMKDEDMSCPSCTRHFLKYGADNGGRKNGNMNLPYLTSVGTLQNEDDIRVQIEEKLRDDAMLRSGSLTKKEENDLKTKYHDNNRLFGWSGHEIITHRDKK